MNSRNRARELIAASTYMSMATADEAGKPWVSVLFYAPDEHCNLFWLSSRSTRHSENIRVRPEVCIVIFTTGRAEGVYIDAVASELTDGSEIRRAADLFRAKNPPDAFTIKGLADVTGPAAWRIYRATPVAAFTQEDGSESGQRVTVRQPVELS